MEQRSIGKNTVEVRSGQIQVQKILMPDRATRRLACHGNEALGSIETDCVMTKTGKGLEIPAGSTAEIQNRERRFSFDGSQQCRNILRDVVVTRADAEVFRVDVIVLQGDSTDLVEVVGVGFHARSIPARASPPRPLPLR